MIQRKLFDKIRARTSSHGIMGELTKVLHLSHSSLYKRINGNVMMSLSEFLTLCKHYNVSADELFDVHQNEVRFRFDALQDRVASYSEFLLPILQDLEWISGFEDQYIYYATNELPFFHQFLYPELTAFKYFIYAKTIWEIPGFENMKFSLQKANLAQHSNQTGKTILQEYYNIPSVEIWTRNMLDNTLKQIRYYLESGGFESSDDALQLIRRLRSMTEHMKKMAISGTKLPLSKTASRKGTELKIFVNEYIFANNTFLVTANEARSVYTTFDNPNFLKNKDASFGKYTYEWFQKLMKRGYPISSHAELNRNEYFEHIKMKIDKAEKRIVALVESL